MSKILKALKLVVVISGSIIILFLAIAYIAAEYYGDELKDVAMSELNKHIDTKIEVQDISFSFIQDFPYASIVFEDVLIMSTKDFSQFELSKWDTDTLLKASKLTLSFHLMSLIEDNFNLKKIEVEKGKLNILADKRDNNNFQFWSNNTSETDSTFSMNLQEIILKEIDLLYVQRAQEIIINSYIENSRLSGQISTDNFSLDISSSIKVNYLEVSNNIYLSDRNCELDVSFDVEKDKYSIKKGRLRIEDMVFNIVGMLQFVEKPTVDIHINSSNLDITSFVSLLPDNQRNYFSNYKSTGTFSVNSSFSGELVNHKSPHIEVSFIIDNATVKNKGAKINVEKLNAKGVFSNGKSNSSVSSSIVFNDLNFAMGSSVFSAGGKIVNLNKPYVSLKAITSINLSDLKQFLQVEDIEQVDGLIDGDILISAVVESNNESDGYQIANLKWSGDINTHNINLKLKDDSNTLNNLNGKFKLLGSDIKIVDLSFAYANCNYNIIGELISPINYLTNNSQILTGNVSVKSPSVNLDNIIDESSTEPFILPSNYNFDIDIHFDKFKYERIEIRDVVCQLQVKPGEMFFNQLGFKTLNGNAVGNVTISEIKNENIQIVGHTIINNIDIHEFFYSLNNFGQDFIVADNLTGDMSGIINFDSKWTNQFEIIDESILLESSVEVINGELYDFEPMQALSDYIKVPDLKHITFSSLKNDIVIQNQKIYIPRMTIYSTALNFEMSGVHDFNQNISYDIKMLLSELLSKRFVKKKKEEWRIEENDEDKIPIFLNFDGNVDNFKISYDWARAKDERKKGRSEERKELKSILHSEFGLFKKDSAKFKIETAEKEKKKKRKVEIIWDEDEDF